MLWLMGRAVKVAIVPAVFQVLAVFYAEPANLRRPYAALSLRDQTDNFAGLILPVPIGVFDRFIEHGIHRAAHQLTAFLKPPLSPE